MAAKQATKRPRAPKITLVITDELIEDAIPRDSSHCLWAEAVKSAYPSAQRIAVDLATIRFSDPTRGLRFTYLTPRAAQVALVQFDQGVKPVPHSVQLRNGHVTRMAQKAKKLISPAQVEQRRKAGEKGRNVQAKTRSALAKTSLRHSGGGGVPDRVGGKTPPIGAGRIRSFGLRGLSY